MYGAARDWLLRAMTSFPIKNPRVLSYVWNASITSAKASNWVWFHDVRN